MALDMQNSFSIVASANLGTDDYQTLTLLYLPLIKSNSYTLYLALFSLLNRESLKSEILFHYELTDLLGMSINELEKARFQLEAIGLMKSYQNGPAFLYCLKCPLCASDFLKHSVLGTCLQSEIGEQCFMNLQKRFILDEKSKENYIDISKQFNDVYHNSSKPSNLKIDGLLKSRSNSNPIRIENAGFDIKKFYSLIKDDYNVKEITNEIATAVIQNSFLYGLDEEDMGKAFIDSLINDQIELGNFIRNIKQIYQKHENSEFKMSGGFGKNEIDRTVEAFERTTPYELLKGLNGGKDLPLSARELKIIDQVRADTGFPKGVINVLMYYAIGRNGGRFPVYNYFDSITRDWKRLGINTTKRAVEEVYRLNGNASGQTEKPKQPVRESTYRPKEKKKRTLDWVRKIIDDEE